MAGSRSLLWRSRATSAQRIAEGGGRSRERSFDFRERFLRRGASLLSITCSSSGFNLKPLLGALASPAVLHVVGLPRRARTDVRGAKQRHDVPQHAARKFVFQRHRSK